MSFMFDTLLYLGRNGEIDPCQLDGSFAALTVTECEPNRLLAKYAKASGSMNLEDPSEDMSVHQQIFHFGVLSALRNDDFLWLEAFGQFTSDADKLFKAGALFKLTAFFGFGEIYTRGDTALEKTLLTGSFADLWFRHIYLYELLARDIAPHQLNPLAHVRNHGRNYVDIFGTEEQVRQARDGRVARLFAQGLLDRIEAAALKTELVPSYKAFFDAYVRSHNRHRGSRMQWAHAHEEWDLDLMRTRLLGGLLHEQFDHQALKRILDAVVR